MDKTKLDFKIRNYKPSDEEELAQIYADAGFFGKPVEAVFSDRNIFTQIIRRYYLKKEPELVFIAEVKGKIVGYLTGSTNQHIHLSLAWHGIRPVANALWKFARGKYKKYPQNKEFLKWIFFKALRQTPKHPKNAAHAHLNIKKGYRGQGIGQALIKTALLKLREQIKTKKLEKVYGIVFTHGHKTEEYFKKAGFKIFDKKRTDLFGNNLKDVYAICITRDVNTLF